MNAGSLAGHIVELFEVIDKSSRPSDRIAAEFFRERTYIGGRDRRCIADAVFGMIRHRRRIEALLERFVDEHPGAAAADAPPARYLPLYWIYAVSLEGAAPGSLVPSLGERWSGHLPGVDPSGFALWVEENKMLDFLGHDAALRLAVGHSFQDWMVQEWLAVHGAETEDLLASLNKPAPVALRVNTLKGDPEGCRRMLLAEGTETESAVYAPAGLVARKRFNRNASKAFKEGYFEVQDEGSQLLSHLASPLPGSKVIDACAGAGGKTLHLAELMQDKGSVLAVDPDRSRLAELARRARRAGLSCIRTVAGDRAGAAAGGAQASLVLVDAPCSGSGTIRRNPMLKWRVSEAGPDHFAKIQIGLLRLNAEYVRQGGVLVYATCSLFRRENEDVVAEFLRLDPRFAPVAPRSPMDIPRLVGGDQYVRLFPHIHNTDGFFAALLQRTA